METVANSTVVKLTFLLGVPQLFWPFTLAALGLALERMFKQRFFRWFGFEASIFAFLWLLSIWITGASPPINFMSRYSVADFVVYMKTMCVMTVVLFVLSVFSFRFLGGSIGKRLAQFKTVNIDGSAITWRTAILRSVILFALGIMIMSPGPLIGYLYGNGSEIASLSMLFMAFGVWMFVAVARRDDGPLRTELSPVERGLLTWGAIRQPREPAVAGELAQTRLEKMLGVKTVYDIS